jgi:hypothetical protein
VQRAAIVIALLALPAAAHDLFPRFSVTGGAYAGSGSSRQAEASHSRLRVFYREAIQ